MGRRRSCLKEGDAEAGPGLRGADLATDSQFQLKTLLFPTNGPEGHFVSVFQSGILLFWQLQNIQISERHPLFESRQSFIPGKLIQTNIQNAEKS